MRPQAAVVRVEFLADGSPDCPLLRFYGADASGFAHLQHLAQELSGDTSVKIDLAADSVFELVNMPGFTLSNDRATGARARDEGFDWCLEPYDWETVAILLEPLADSTAQAGSFQWLDVRSTRSIGLPVLASRSPDGLW